ncbi:MAG: NAD(P)H-dependent oxidoreductase [Candidatus Latescibacteria bacterium]|jgi:FMN reductase|nr:NAD(P)H-dependent oxidoreductase [Candidatus Latescibacterota bacterium]
MTITIFSCSMHPMSRSYVLAKQAEENLKAEDVDVRFFDLRDYDLDFCGQPEARDNPAVGELRNAVQDSAAVLMAVPIYNFYVNAVAKNLIELTGRAWIYKLVGFMCAAGGQASYMSVMNIANSLMLDFRCLVVPRFVYALGDAFGNDRTEDMFVADEGILERLQELTDMTVKLSAAVVPVIETLPESKGRT